MNRKLLVICGPTATGKTNLAVCLAKKLNGEIISADSRQVYKGMDIGTGKDLPANSKFQIPNDKFGSRNSNSGFYTNNGVKIWGYDLVTPAENFSVSQYSDIAGEIVTDIWKRKRLPIIVGGAGLYIRSLTDVIETSSIRPDPELREGLGKKSADELFGILSNLDRKKAESLNNSDKKNPRRLIRAIEVAKQVIGNKLHVTRGTKINYDSLLMIGLIASKTVLDKRVENRVKKRIRNGFEKEAENLLTMGIDRGYLSMQGLGYRQYGEYHKGSISREEFIERWIIEERRYSKRQMTWFNKDKRIIWFDIRQPDFETEVENKVQNWYYERERK